MKHVVVGIGEVGGAILANLQDAGYQAMGFDYGQQQSSSSERQAPHWLHVCIPFTNEQEFASQVGIWTHGSSCSLVVVHSTVTPGATELLQAVTLLPAVHSPVNGKHVSSRTMESYIKTLPKFFGGPEQCRGQITRELRGVWDVCWLGEAKITETMKLLATTYYGLLINWAQFVSQICTAQDISYEKVMSVFTMIDSEDWRIDNKYPGKWGGHCVEPNFKLLKDTHPHPLLDAMQKMNEEYED